MTPSLPDAFVTRMAAQLGPEWPTLSAALNAQQPVSIRRNPAKTWQPQGHMIPWCSTGYYLPARPVFTMDPALHAGGYYVQEASSMALEQAVRQSIDLSQPHTVLDLCAAPGGKSTHLLSMLSPESVLVSNEVVRSRTTALQENLLKWGYPNSILTHVDPARFAAVPGFFDVMLVDAPCSGEGLFRKDPASRLEWTPENANLCSLRQRRILEDAWDALREDGIMIYSTCTFNPEENEGNLAWLAQHYAVEFLPLTFDSAWGVVTVQQQQALGYQFMPHRAEGEGFFLSVLRKKSSTKDQSFRKSALKKDDALHKQLSGWLQHPEQFHLEQHLDFCWLQPHAVAEKAAHLRAHLPVISAGTLMAERKGQKFIPAHAMALSTELSRSAFPVLELDTDDALRYLRKDSLSADLPVGYALVTSQGLALGWVNVLSNRLNNLYPTEWRIRMDIHR